MPTGAAPKAFISYKWEGENIRKWVELFARDLRRNGIDAVLDVWEVEYGASFISYMKRNIPAADVFFFIMTPESIAAVEAEEGKGGAVNFEVELATELRISGEKFRLIPILLQGEKPAKFLRAYKYVDFRDPEKYSSTMKDLLQSLTGVSQKPPLLGSGSLQYSVQIYKMLPAIAGSPFRSLNAKFEPFVGFPFYSHPSDHPSHWPPRVYEDRQAFTPKFLRFLSDSRYADRIRHVLGGDGSKVETVTSTPMDADEDRERMMVEAYMKLRMLLNFELNGDRALIEKKLGKDAADEFLDLEKTREADEQRMPNRLLTIALKHSHEFELRNVVIDIQVIGTVYDLLVNGQRPFERKRIEDMSTKRIVLDFNTLPAKVVSLVRIWYNYISLAQRWDPAPIHFQAEPTEGVLLYRLGAEGQDSISTESLILDEGVYEPCEISFSKT